MSCASPTFAMMNGQRYYSFFAFAFLFLLMGVKMTGYHTLTHCQDEETLHCELCVFVAQQEAEAFSLPSDVGPSPSNHLLMAFREIVSAALTFKDRPTPDIPFSRPPPVLV